MQRDLPVLMASRISLSFRQKQTGAPFVVFPGLGPNGVSVKWKRRHRPGCGGRFVSLVGFPYSSNTHGHVKKHPDPSSFDFFPLIIIMDQFVKSHQPAFRSWFYTSP
jgi:hypothetical protein